MHASESLSELTSDVGVRSIAYVARSARESGDELDSIEEEEEEEGKEEETSKGAYLTMEQNSRTQTMMGATRSSSSISSSTVIGADTEFTNKYGKSKLRKLSSKVLNKVDQMTYLQIMAAGAISRTLAQTIMHPANTIKTMLQVKSNGRKINLTPERLLRGVDAQFLFSLPHGAFYFCVIDQVKAQLNTLLPRSWQYATDFAASAISTIVCSIVSTPQMVLTDRLMAGVYPSFPVALGSIFKAEGMMGFYAGWWPALAQKIPSYGLTWMFFQQLKRAHEHYFEKKPNAETNFVLGALAAAGSVAVMIPMDTVKTRLVIQIASSKMPYTGVRDCFMRIYKEEGILAFYRSLPPRLASVVPMIAIQFGLYEIIKSKVMQYNCDLRVSREKNIQE